MSSRALYGQRFLTLAIACAAVAAQPARAQFGLSAALTEASAADRPATPVQIAAAPARPGTQPAAQPSAPDPGGKFSHNGLLDLYYMYNFNHPQVGVPAAGRAFDVKNDSFSVSLLEVNVTRSVGAQNPVGFTATLTAGKTADIVHATEPGGTNTYKYIQQLFGTYVIPTSTPVTLDFGKFVTWLGSEVIESSSNDNYSRSFLFNYAIPFYHAGLRFTAPLVPNKLTGGIYVVNGWNNAEDDNGSKTLGASLALTASKSLSVGLNYIGGNESQGAAILNPAFISPAATPNVPPIIDLNVQMVDLTASWNATAKLKLGLNADYASASKPGKRGGNWSGEALYGRYQFSPSSAFALRGEHFEDSAGIRTGAAQNLNEITSTLEYVLKTNFITRLEYRHDHAGTQFFPTKSGGSNNQDTLTLAGVVKF